MRELIYDALRVRAATDDKELGTAAAEDFARSVSAVLRYKDEIAVILSLNAVQPTLLPALIARDDIDWSRITVLRADTYLSVAGEDPECGESRLWEELLERVRPSRFLHMDGAPESIEAELNRYAKLIYDLDPDVCVVGVGRNGHLAYCEPPIDTLSLAKVQAVALSPGTRRQILDASLFRALDDVPDYGLTLTMGALLRPRHVLALAHLPETAEIIRQALHEPTSIMVPVSLLREHTHARMYLGPAAAAALG